MLDDEAFLDKLAAAPRDDQARLVYADWLEERGDGRAALLRAQVAGAPPVQGDPLAYDPDWLARVERTEIENCTPLQFKFQCPKRWEDLALTEQARVRFCSACQQQVYHCATVSEARDHAREGHCVAVHAFVPRRPGDLREPEDYLIGDVEPLMGIVALPPDPPEPPPPEKPKKWWQFWR